MVRAGVEGLRTGGARAAHYAGAVMKLIASRPNILDAKPPTPQAPLPSPLAAHFKGPLPTLAFGNLRPAGLSGDVAGSEKPKR